MHFLRIFCALRQVLAFYFRLFVAFLITYAPKLQHMAAFTLLSSLRLARELR